MLQSSRVLQKHQNEFINGRKSLLTVKKAPKTYFKENTIFKFINIFWCILVIVCEKHIRYSSSMSQYILFSNLQPAITWYVVSLTYLC
jgi:hypothetical protein